MTNEIMSVNPPESYIMPERTEGSIYQTSCTDQVAKSTTNKPVPSPKSMSNKLTPDSLSPIELSIVTERLRQARYSFNIALSATTASFLIGAGLLLSNKISEGAVIATGGLASSVPCIQLAKDANRRLDKTFTELTDEGGL